MATQLCPFTGCEIRATSPYCIEKYVPHLQCAGSLAGQIQRCRQIQRLLIWDSHFSWGQKAGTLPLETPPSSNSTLASLRCKENLGKKNHDNYDCSGANRAPGRPEERYKYSDPKMLPEVNVWIGALERWWKGERKGQHVQNYRVKMGQALCWAQRYMEMMRITAPRRRRGECAKERELAFLSN